MSGTDPIDPIPARIPSGVPGLDTVLRGGLLTGSVYIIGGGPGAGKTILANQICFSWISRGQRALYVTLLAESHRRLLRNLSGMSFFDAEPVDDSIVYESAFETLKSEGLNGILRFLTRNSKLQDASLIVLDGLFALEETARSEAEFREFINDLGALADITDCTVLLLTNSQRDRGSPEYTMVDGWIEIDSVNEGPQLSRFLRVNKFRGSDFISGAHQLRISKDGVRIYPRLEALGVVEPAAVALEGRTTSGIAALDDVLGGGLPSGSASLVVGPSGIGKTSLGLQFICAGSQEEPGLVFGFYEDRERLVRRARSLGLDLDARLADGRVRLIWLPPTEGVLDQLAEELLSTVQGHSVRRLLVDGLDGFRHACLHRQRLGRFLTALTARLRELGVTSVFTVEQQSLLGNVEHIEVGPLSAVAENILHLQYTREQSKLGRTLSVIKVRESDFDSRSIAFDVTDAGIRLGA